MTSISFSGLGLADPVLRALNAQNYTTPTPIQAEAIPPLMAGRDLLGIAQTGTGKTAAFALPLLHKLAALKSRPAPRTARALILAPTRELAGQIADSFRLYGKHLDLSIAVVFGGVRQGPQIKALARGVDVLIATPGRLMDHLGQGNIRLSEAKTLVLDEADRMLDMGFVRDVRKIVRDLPHQRQTVFLSATMPKEVEKLAREILGDAVRVEVTPKVVTVAKVEQIVHFVDASAKRSLLTKMLENPDMARVIVFTRTKHGANRVTTFLHKASIEASAIHGNKSQAARQKALDGFKSGRLRVLVATDIAARGIDVADVSHVVNYEIPNEPETYVHRIGRTARAGAGGVAVSLCDPSEKGYLVRIDRLTGQTLAGPAPRLGKPQSGNRQNLASKSGPNSNPNSPKSRPQTEAGRRRRRSRGASRRKAA
ncbi:ATP-dependent RNA helicase RhlE [hydrothermal vent metagenome]|uniref:ATP-dependent RNA helicase RhlE n=1 Tax=hydrothermal vent metagenome TaxID=652676 RepID=A0A3B0TBU0_9ZZZZ